VADAADLEALRTQMANQAASLAEGVTQGFAGFRMGAAGYIVELTAPEGPSTSGGAHARQHLRLVPTRRGYAVVVAGAVDTVARTAELRSHEHVSLVYEMRFGRALEITPEEYEDFLSKALVVLNLARIRGLRAPTPPEVIAEARARRRVSIPVLIVFIVVVVLAAIVMFRVAQTLRAGG
jgi:hypothetical protein